MYLTRTKLLAAGIVLVGVLTTGVGVLSRADAQAPPSKGYDEALRKYYDALRSHEAARDRWEYKFIPVEKPLTPDALEKVLAGADREGWSYCGSQELAEERTGKIGPHMVFKRPRAGKVAESADVRQEAAAALQRLAGQQAEAQRLKALEAERAALLDQLKKQEDELAKRRAEGERARKLADEIAASDKATRDALDKARDDAAKQRAAAEQALGMAGDKVAADRAAREVEKARQQELEVLKARYEEMIRAMQAELKAKSVPDGNKSLPSGAANPLGSTAKAPGPDAVVTSVVKLRHVDGKTAAAALARVYPQAKIVAEVSPDAIVLKGPNKVVTEAREFLQAKIDASADGATAGRDGGAEVAAIKLTHANAADVAKVLEKVGGSSKAVRISYDTASNAVFISAPAAVLADLKKVAAELDKSSGPAK